MVWYAQGEVPVHVSYHWLSPDKKNALVFEGARTPLPHDVNPGESITVQSVVQAPPKPGTYYLQWDLVQERVIWFSFKSGRGSDPVLQVVNEASTATQAEPYLAQAMPSQVDMQAAMNTDAVSRMELWRVAFRMFRAHPITGVGPDAFRNLYGEYAGVTNWNKNIYTNNTYIEMFTNLGILGGLAFLWLAGLALWRAARSVLRQPVDGWWILGLGATASLVAFFFHGLGDYFLFSTPMYVTFWFVLSLATRWPVMRQSGLGA